MDRIGAACAGNSGVAALLGKLGKMVGALDAERAEQRLACRTLSDQVGQQYRLLREASAAGGLPAELLAQIDAAAPAGVVPIGKRAELWAVQASEPDELYPMHDRQAAELFAAVTNDVRGLQGMPVTAKVVRSPWSELEHWQGLAKREAQWVGEAQELLAAALQRNGELEEQLSKARAGESLPVRALRGGRIYEDASGARFVLLGQADWRGQPVVVFRCGKTGTLRIQPGDEIDCMQAIHE